ncbi:MAG: NusA-like transcription termination signal-binding factor, partial [Thermoprotei archaeon]
PRGINIQRLRRLLNKDIEIVGYSDKLEEQVKYALAPAKVREVKLVKRPSGKKIVYASVEPSDKGIAIGKNGRNVARATLILKRYFGIDSVVIV